MHIGDAHAIERAQVLLEGAAVLFINTELVFQILDDLHTLPQWPGVTLISAPLGLKKFIHLRQCLKYREAHDHQLLAVVPSDSRVQAVPVDAFRPDRRKIFSIDFRCQKFVNLEHIVVLVVLDGQLLNVHFQPIIEFSFLSKDYILLHQFTLDPCPAMINQHQSDTPVKSFSFEDSQNWLKALHEVGAVVLKNVLNEGEVATATGLFWEWLQHLGTDIKRDNPETWEQNCWPGQNLGFFATYGGCHTKASWFIRTNDKVKGAFKKIWNTENLITSFDLFIGWKPWWINPNWRPQVENLHSDQNPYFKKGLKCVQGMVPLKRVRRDEVGGLMVVPFTNNDQTQKELCERYPGVKNSETDWLQLRNNDPLMQPGKAVLIECDAGDLILWDSRTVHGGKVCQPSQQFKAANKSDLVRLSMTVTMVPRQWAGLQILKKRQEAFKKRVALTHWPHQYNQSWMGNFLPGVDQQKLAYEWPQLEGSVKQLV